MQEVVLARETVYLMGTKQLPMIELLEHRRNLSAIDGTSMLLDRMFVHLRARITGLDFARTAFALLNSGSACTLEAAVTEARNRRTTDGRDKLFGVLSLCQCHGSEEAVGLTADYRKPIQEVFYDCAAALLQSKNTGIFLLSLVGQIRHGCAVDYAFNSNYIKLFKPEKGFVTNLPSWVPDLSAPARPRPLRDLTKLKFAAASFLEPAFATAGPKIGTLQINAAIIDVITATGDCRSTRFVQPVWRLLRILFKLPGSPAAGTYAPTGEPVVSAFWRTLAAGATHAGEEKEHELTDQDFVDWFVIFAEESYVLSERKMRAGILQELDEDDLDLAEEPDDRQHHSLWDVFVHERDHKKLDRYKIRAVREFIASFDSPVYGIRETIKRRHERFKAMSRLQGGVEQTLWTHEDPVFENVFEISYSDRRIFATTKGYMGTAPWTAMEGNVVMLVAGAYVPYVFRPSGKTKGAWELVGEAYCHGIMFGELLEDPGSEFSMIDVV